LAGSLNKVTLIGNVGADPEVRNLNSGNAVANLSLATSESWKDKNSGEKKEVTQWHRIVVWNDGLISVIEKYVSKGSKLYIEGQLQTRKWQDQEGNDRYSTEVVLTGFDAKLILLGDAGNGGGSRDQNDNANRPGNQRNSGDGGSSRNSGGGFGGGGGGFGNAMDDDIPFAPEWR